MGRLKLIGARNHRLPSPNPNTIILLPYKQCLASDVCCLQIVYISTIRFYYYDFLFISNGFAETVPVSLPHTHDSVEHRVLQGFYNVLSLFAKFTQLAHKFTNNKNDFEKATAVAGFSFRFKSEDRC